MDASVVICAYSDERWSLLERAVRSAEGQDPPPAEVVVVIDHNDALLERAGAAFPDALVVPNAEERGLSGARNTGWRRATGEVIAFLHDDPCAQEGWMRALLDAYRAPDVVGVGGRIVPDWAEAPPPWFPPEFLWVMGCSYRGLPEDRRPVRNMIGANMSFRRDVLDAIDGFDAGMGRVGDRLLHCEDTEACIRASAALPGSVILHDPDAVVRHHVPAARTSWRYFRARCYTEGIAKARLAQIAGTERGLASERAYALRTLPSGMLRGVRAGGAGGLGRAGAIAAGLVMTAAGYVAGRAAYSRR